MIPGLTVTDFPPHPALRADLSLRGRGVELSAQHKFKFADGPPVLLLPLSPGGRGQGEGESAFLQDANIVRELVSPLTRAEDRATSPSRGEV